jgi:hypothetical protein
MTAAEAIAQIEAIDRDIDAHRASWLMRVHCRPDSCATWQRFRDANPAFDLHDCALSVRRGLTQQVRDAAIHREWLAEQRSQKLREIAQRRRDAADSARRDRTTALTA